MIPNYYMQLDSLPLNPSGKVDKQALPVPKKEKNLKRHSLVHLPREKKKFVKFSLKY